MEWDGKVLIFTTWCLESENEKYLLSSSLVDRTCREKRQHTNTLIFKK